MDTSIVFMVAGMSSRFKLEKLDEEIRQNSLVNGEDMTHKGLVAIGSCNERLLDISINQAKEAGFNNVVFIVSDKTEDHFKSLYGDSHNGMSVSYAKQKVEEEYRNGKPWGTTDAIVAAKDAIKGSFVVCNGDDLYGSEAFKQLYNHLSTSTGCATLGYKVGGTLPDKGEVNRGYFNVKDGHVHQLEEKFKITKDNLEELGLSEDSHVSMNIFAMDMIALEHLKEKLDSFKTDNDGHQTAECLLPVEINGLISDDKIKMKFYPTDSMWHGVTSPEDAVVVKDKLTNS